MEDKLCIFPQDNKITGLLPFRSNDLLNLLQIQLIRIDTPLMTNQLILHPPKDAINYPLIILKM